MKKLHSIGKKPYHYQIIYTDRHGEYYSQYFAIEGTLKNTLRKMGNNGYRVMHITREEISQ